MTEDVVPPVAVNACRSLGVSPGRGLAVEGLRVLPALGGVTPGAVHGRNVGGGMGKGYVLVALDTPDPGGAVNGGGQIFGGDQELLAPSRALEHGGISMTHKTHLVVLERPCGSGWDGKSHQDQCASKDCVLRHLP